ncbi:nitrous oxide reductase accessory protein NosL [Pseudomonas sp. MYb185]|uniref:nitrous oxide reductase accessory protein NosL n=1 Tax=Pseudomonas sp. MYb185 TaxID=1848729 RepID=UPI000CFDB64A|nr:nitrous oxide reductase accessory protein NosL [Pseudomonas sp. MYb185]PRB84238.1 NosL protein [Pseudomonas sp. MYb185]
MKIRYNLAVRTLLVLLLGLTLAACGDPEEAQVTLDPVAFHDTDECHVCGMIIMDFTGPKGQVVERGEVKKFCSTAEMLSWWLQPENRILQARLYVHDMAQSHWDHPDDGHLVDATQAWYVAGTALEGAMGASLASFADKQAAEALAAEYDGATVLHFDEIDQEFLQQAAAAQHGAAANHSTHSHDNHSGH